MSWKIVGLWLGMVAVAGCDNALEHLDEWQDHPTFYGTDAGEWAGDGACQDPRFNGAGAPATMATEGRDATDCRAAHRDGRVNLPEHLLAELFGEDTGDWVHDGECDDPYFEGEGVAMLTAWEERGADASDCRYQWSLGRARLR